jgi:hypothetical protein
MPQVIDLRRDDPWQRLFPQLLMNFAMAKMNQKFTKDQTDIQGQRLEQAEKLRLSKDPAISQAEEGKPFDFEYGGTKYKHVPATLGTETVGDTELLVRRRGENVLSATPMPQSKLNPWKITEQGLIYTDPKGGIQIDPRFKKTPGTTIKTSTDAQGNMHVFALGKNAEVVAKKTFKGVGKPSVSNVPKKKDPTEAQALKRISSIDNTIVNLDKKDKFDATLAAIFPEMRNKLGQKIGSKEKAKLMESLDAEREYLFQFTPKGKLKERAVSELEKQGKPVTDANIDYVIELLK